MEPVALAVTLREALEIEPEGFGWTVELEEVEDPEAEEEEEPHPGKREEPASASAP